MTITTSPWRIAAYAYALIIAAGLSYFIVGIPLQLSDGLGNLLELQKHSLGELIAGQGTAAGYLRPLLWAQLKLAYELANGHYFLLFKSIHVAQVAAAVVLAVRLLDVRRAVDFAAAAFAIAVLVGHPASGGTVREAFPINTFLTIVVCCLAAANLSFGAPARWRDAGAVALLVFATLTVESGLLVAVCLVAAWFAGFRGVSRGAIATVAALTVAYAALRFGPLQVGSPALDERSSGFGFTILDGVAVAERFGDAPWRFYAYNVASQIGTVLFAEPRGGVWIFVRGVVHGTLEPWNVICVIAALGVTLLIARYVITRGAPWRRALDGADRLVLIFAAVLSANVFISYPYTKEVIVSPAAAFFALAGAVAVRDVVLRLGHARLQTVAACSLLLGLLSAAWAVRLVGAHYELRATAFIVRNEWAAIHEWQRRNDVDLAADPAAAALTQQLRSDAIAMRVPAPHFSDADAARYLRDW